MSSRDEPSPGGRVRALRILAWLMAASAIGFGLFTAIFGVVNPAQEPHAFHNVVVASLLIVLSAPPAVALALRPAEPMRPLVMLTAVGAAGIVTMLAALTADPFTLPFIVLVGVLWLLVPERRALVPDGRASLPLLALVGLAIVPLSLYALDQAALQRTDRTSEHAAFFHWVESSFYAVAVVLLGALAGLRPRAYRLAGWMAGVAAGLIGLGGLLLAGYASAPPAPWALAALAGGVVFTALVALDGRTGTAA